MNLEKAHSQQTSELPTPPRSEEENSVSRDLSGLSQSVAQAPQVSLVAPRCLEPFTVALDSEHFLSIENRFVVSKGDTRVGEGWIGSLGLADANYCI